MVKIEVASTPQAFGTDKVCQVWAKEVDNLVEPVVIKIPLTHDETKDMGRKQLEDDGVTCAYSEDWEGEWRELNEKCPETYYNQLGKEEYVCCSSHLSSFSVGKQIDVSEGHFDFAAVPLGVIWIFTVLTLSIGAILDWKKACTVD